MSAWGVGRNSGTPTLSGGAQTAGGAGPDLKSFVDRVVQWIPADVIAVYTVGMTALSTNNPDSNPSPVWLVIAAALAFVLVLLGAQQTRKRVGGHDFVLAALAVAAFAIWSLAIPNSGWYDLSWIADNPGWVAVIAAVGGIMFGAIAGAFAED